MDWFLDVNPIFVFLAGGGGESHLVMVYKTHLAYELTLCVV